MYRSWPHRIARYAYNWGQRLPDTCLPPRNTSDIAHIDPGFYENYHCGDILGLDTLILAVIECLIARSH